MSIYERFGVEPIINASGSVTRLGGAPMPQAVLEAFQQAARQSVPLEHLQAAASRHIAQWTGAEAGLVTAGCAASLTLGTAAILTGYDLARIEQLPHCDGFAHQMIIGREQRSGYDHAVRAAGARLREVGFNEIIAGAGVRRTELWEYEAAFDGDTAGVVYVYTPHSQPPLADVVQLAHQHGLPVLVDAAGELPPRANLSALIATGADLVAFSGGKAIRGPQSSGILCGRRHLIGAAAANMLDMDDHVDLWSPPPELIDKQKLRGIPRHGIGRGLKVSKEEIVALLTALDLFASGAYDDQATKLRAYLETIVAALADLPVRCDLREPHDGEGSPVLEIKLDETALGQTAWEVCRALRQGSPAVYVGHGRLHEGVLVVHPLCLDASQSDTLARRLRQQLLAACQDVS